MVQKLPLTWWLFCFWWHVYGTMGYSLERWVLVVLSMYRTSVLPKLACSQKCVYMQDVLCSVIKSIKLILWSWQRSCLFWCRLTVHLCKSVKVHTYMYPHWKLLHPLCFCSEYKPALKMEPMCCLETSVSNCQPAPRNIKVHTYMHPHWKLLHPLCFWSEYKPALKMEPMCCLETSVSHCQPAPRNISEDLRPQFSSLILEFQRAAETPGQVSTRQVNK